MHDEPPSDKKVLADIFLGYFGYTSLGCVAYLSFAVYTLTCHVIKPSWTFYPVSAVLFYYLILAQFCSLTDMSECAFILYFGASIIYAFIDIVRKGGIEEACKGHGSRVSDGGDYWDWGCS